MKSRRSRVAPGALSCLHEADLLAYLHTQGTFTSSYKLIGAVSFVLGHYKGSLQEDEEEFI